VAASTFLRGRGRLRWYIFEWGTFSGGCDRRPMIVPGKVWPGSGVSLVIGDEAEEVDRCAAWMQGEELAEGREVRAGAIEGIVSRQHQLILVKKGVPM
jgi:hypothetical protein